MQIALMEEGEVFPTSKSNPTDSLSSRELYKAVIHCICVGMRLRAFRNSPKVIPAERRRKSCQLLRFLPRRLKEIVESIASPLAGRR